MRTGVLFVKTVCDCEDRPYPMVSRNGRTMPGVFEVPHGLPVGRVIEDLMLLAHYSLDGEWEGQVRYLPLR